MAIRLATLPDGGPTGSFFNDDGVIPWWLRPAPDAQLSRSGPTEPDRDRSAIPRPLC
jgi:hypothetical protein